MLGSTGKVMSLASSMGAGSERGSVKPSPCLQRRHLQLVDGLDDLVEFALQPLVVADVEVAGQQGVERLVEVLPWRPPDGRPDSWPVRRRIAFRPARSGPRPDRLAACGLGLPGSWAVGCGLLGDGRGDFGALAWAGSERQFLGFVGLASCERDSRLATEDRGRNHDAKQCHRCNNSETALSCVPPVDCDVTTRRNSGSTKRTCKQSNCWSVNHLTTSQVTSGICCAIRRASTDSGAALRWERSSCRCGISCSRGR